MQKEDIHQGGIVLRGISHLLISTIIRIVYMFCLDIPIKKAEFMLSGDISHAAPLIGTISVVMSVPPT